VPIVATGKKYFNNSSRTGSIRENNIMFMANKPEIMTTSGGNPVANNHNSIQPI
jgi:hypothetical protein